MATSSCLSFAGCSRFLIWNNTNRVVSNRVVSKGPVYPSNAKLVTLFCIIGGETPDKKQQSLRISGAGFAPDLQIWLLGTTPFDTTPFICLRGAVKGLEPRTSGIREGIPNR